MDSPIEFVTPDKNENIIVKKCEFIMLIASNTIYLVLIVKAISRYVGTKDRKFWFLLIASSFAFANNTNDIYYRIMAPLYSTYNCSKHFLRVFKGSGSLNWIPVSLYQVLRLYQITYNYYQKSWRILLLIISLTLSAIYCCCYFLNLSQFYSNKSKFGGCVVSNTGDYKYFVEISDIIDSSFSLAVVIFTLFLSLRNQKHYKLRHHRIKAVLDRSVIIFVILLLSKVVFYSLIILNSTRPGGDIFWDGLSIIVLGCTYQLLIIKPKIIKKIHQQNRINDFHRKLKMLGFSSMDHDYKSSFSDLSSSRTSTKIPYLYTKNSKGELNFPSLKHNYLYYNNIINKNNDIFNNQYMNDKTNTSRNSNVNMNMNMNMYMNTNTSKNRSMSMGQMYNNYNANRSFKSMSLTNSSTGGGVSNISNSLNNSMFNPKSTYSTSTYNKHY
ncbi:hypothetical protein BCR32DRAFT_268707 [Anaeromyces robustus]|uniref:Uncharacterized protein n=1 Tax=Anaeromyces robustus TaxID=1754192 RepID=A0A1Y1X4J8_9FUNG|nr:hypothetical protein BCR32DRAFT_268707 [Anaeromyces robustus]|eukprot:ORX80737.1 hypothetical protein BCR32DRAFT_268707 [Anaeromyces robustus]